MSDLVAECVLAPSSPRPLPAGGGRTRAGPGWGDCWGVRPVAAGVALPTPGALVTTFRVGMADPVWPTYPWHLALISWKEPSAGFLIEHAHRLMGFLVGVLAWWLANFLWAYELRRGLRAFGLITVNGLVALMMVGHGLREVRLLGVMFAVTAGAVALMIAVAGYCREPAVTVRVTATVALAGVMVQGLFGGFRVKLNELAGTDLALVHGVFAPVVFAALAAVAQLTSPAWLGPTETAAPAARRWSLAAVGLVFGQLLLGALVRHVNTPLWQRLHLLAAFLVVLAVVCLVRSAWERRDGRRRLAGPASVLAALVALQVSLGVEAWMLRFGRGPMADYQPVTVGQAVVRTLHVLTGAWVLAAAVVLALRANRRPTAAVIQPKEAA